MKRLTKKLGILTLCTALMALMSAPALAQSVGIELDGKVYTFLLDDAQDGSGEPAHCELDGRTFVIDGDEVTVLTPGEPDIHLPLTSENTAESIVTVMIGGDGEADTSIADDASLATGSGAEYVWEETVFVTDGEGDADQERGWSARDAAEYAKFAPYGLSCDAASGKLWYLGEPVRVFEDVLGLPDGTAELSYFDEDGAVDVRALRDAQGELTGLEPLSEVEFAGRDLRKWTNPEPVRGEAVATDEEEMTPEAKAAFFAQYEAVGLRYDAAADRLYFGERPVRNFLDVRQSNGEPMTGGKFHGALTQLRFDGELDVTILRDYNRPDANGDGRLLGVGIVEAIN